MKRQLLILGTLLVLLASILGVFTMQKSGSASTARAVSPTPIFQDNFDSYSPGPLPTGKATNQWTSVTASTGFTVAVSATVENSWPNSLQFSLGNTAKGVAFATKRYASSTATHALRFELYIDPSLTLGKQSIGLAEAFNLGSPKNGVMQVWLAKDHSLTVYWINSLGASHTLGTSTVLNSSQWYVVELDQTISATTGSWSLWLNGTSIASQTAIDTGTSPVKACRFGDMLGSHGTLSGSFYVDNVVTSTQHIG